MTEQAVVLDALFEFLMDRAGYDGTLKDLAEELGFTRSAIADARSHTRSAEFISEYKWEVGYVGVGANPGHWQICDLSNPENAERSKMKRWPEIAEACRRLAAVARLHEEGLEAQNAAAEALAHAKAETRTVEAMVALADTYKATYTAASSNGG